ncbi:hypothetical protein [Actinomyces bowdenii]|nr:hypothetical protein [Actinomyces bowdenii]
MAQPSTVLAAAPSRHAGMATPRAAAAGIVAGIVAAYPRRISSNSSLEA